MHVFLLEVPGLVFAAIIPKGSYVTLVLLGDEINNNLIQSFLNCKEVKNCFPPGWDMTNSYPCQCYPKINLNAATQPFADRVVLIGDCSVTKLYKNGIGAAYVAAKSAATTAIFNGISKEDFKQQYWRTCKSISFDNNIGKLIFLATQLVRKRRFTKRGIFQQVIKEQARGSKQKIMCSVLWDTFTGSSTYRDILLRTLKPTFILDFTWELILSLFNLKIKRSTKKVSATSGVLGKLYKDGDSIIVQGNIGDCMYVIQSGKVEVVQVKEGREVPLAVLNEGEFFGEMSLFERIARSTTVKAKGEARILTIDKNTFLHSIQKDPTMAFRIVEKMSSRLRDINNQFGRIRASDRRNWSSRPEHHKKKDVV